jgi:hypothetical protein
MNNASAGEAQNVRPNASSSVKKNFMAAQIARPPRLIQGKAARNTSPPQFCANFEVG